MEFMVQNLETFRIAYYQLSLHWKLTVPLETESFNFQ